jgi:hypothetical protein
MRELTAGKRAPWGLIGMGGVLLVLGAGTGCVVTEPAPGSAPPYTGVGCNLASRVWEQTSPGPCGASQWRFALAADGTWQATERGCAGATGVARYDGAVVTMDFQYGGGAGRYTWPLNAQCRSDVGTVTWTMGPLMGQTIASTLAPAP